MRKVLLLLISLLFASCSELIDPPKKLIPEDKMAEMIAELALNDQVSSFVTSHNMENGTRYILNKNKIKAPDFIESYKYYTATGALEKILNDAQSIVISKDPGAKDYIDKKLKDNKNAPTFAR